jgi:DNA repair exonuclease SbcCD ATPase subunit
MRVKSAYVQNFASYKDLEFDFTDQGLTLVQGPTGAGKSTLCDIIPWILFGITAKGGKVDEIRSWNSTSPTFGSLILDNGMEIVRYRNPNDLYFCYDTVNPIRGKDLNDTQKMLNSKLNITPELYLSGAYFHEFSQTAQFFTTTAKNRREICEQIVDLTLAKKLQSGISERTKEVAAILKDMDVKEHTIESQIKTLKSMEIQEKVRFENWNREHDKTILYMRSLADKFETGRSKTICKTCPTCHTELVKAHTVIDNSPNHHLDRLEQLLQETNPYSSGLKDFTNEINDLKDAMYEINISKTDLLGEKGDLNLLEDVAINFRSRLIQNTIVFIQEHTNTLLTNHFDAEIKVTFSATDADKLEVEIQKDGNICSFTQLSKGQRQLLKLCFGVSIMRAVSNHSGVSFTSLFFDEALDGLDDVFKLKAYKLLEELSLSHENVFVVEHNEALKTMFPNSYKVELVNGHSEIKTS